MAAALTGMSEKALVRAGLLGEKRNVGQRHVFINRAALPEVHALIERGESHHPAFAALEPEHAIGLQMEIAGPTGAIEALPLLPPFHVKADGLQRVIIHAAVDGEAQRLALGGQRRGERLERAIGLAIAIEIVERQTVFPEIETADRIARAIEVARRTGAFGRSREAHQPYRNDGGEERPHHGTSCRPCRWPPSPQ